MYKIYASTHAIACSNILQQLHAPRGKFQRGGRISEKGQVAEENQVSIEAIVICVSCPNDGSCSGSSKTKEYVFKNHPTSNL